MNIQQLYDKFYKDLNPDDYYMFELQQDWAINSLQYYLFFNSIDVLDISTISSPYIFTKKEIANTMQYWLDMLNQKYLDGKDFTLSPDCNGGITATYTGPKDLIVTLDLKSNNSLILDAVSPYFSIKQIVDKDLNTDLKFDLVQAFCLQLDFEYNYLKGK